VRVHSFVETRDATIPRFLDLKARVRSGAQSRLVRGTSMEGVEPIC